MGIRTAGSETLAGAVMGSRAGTLLVRSGMGALGILMALGIAEVSVRQFAPQPPLVVVPDPVLRWVHPRGRQFTMIEPGTHRQVTLSISANGLRDRPFSYQKQPGIRRILVLGDSFTEGAYVQVGETYPKQLEAILSHGGRRIEVINAGVSGYGTDQELLFLTREGLRYDPDLVLLGFFTGNDIEDNGTKLLFQLEGERLVVNPVRQSSVTSWVTRAKADLQQHLQLYRFVVDATTRIYTVRRFLGRFGLLESMNADQLAYDRRHWGQPLVPEIRILLRQLPPDVERGWQLTNALLSELHRATAFFGARLLVVAIPSQAQVELSRLDRLAKKLRISRDAFDPDQPQHRLAQWSRTEGVSVVDLLPSLRARTQQGQRMYFEEGHWNVFGHRVAAELMAGAAQRELDAAQPSLP